MSVCVCVRVEWERVRVEVGRVMQESALIFRSLSQAPLGYGDGGMSTTQELEACQKTVLSPYLYFLKLVSEVTDTVSGAAAVCCCSL